MRSGIATVVLEISRNEQVDQPFAWLNRPCGYRVSMDGDRAADIELPWPDLLPLLAALEGPRALAVADELGRTLQRVLRAAGWDRAEERVAATLALGQRPVLQLNSHAAELTLLPWELIPLGASGYRLGQGQVLLRYGWPGTRTPAMPSDGPGRLVFAWSDGGGRVPWAEHRRAILDAVARGAVTFSEEVDELPAVSLRTLADRLGRRDAPVRALHLLCHGVPLSRAPGTFGLALDSPGLNPEDGAVDGEALAALLAPHVSSLRLVVLCACRGAGWVAGASQLGSVAHALHRAGIQTVIASRAQLSVDGSVAFTRRLYSELIGGAQTIEEAFVRARADLNVHPSRRDWIDVQLFGRAQDGDTTRLELAAARAPVTPIGQLFVEHGLSFGAAVDLARLRRKLATRGSQEAAIDRVLTQLTSARAIVDLRDGDEARKEATEDALVAIWALIERTSPTPSGGHRRLLKIVSMVLAVTGGGVGIGEIVERDPPPTAPDGPPPVAQPPTQPPTANLAANPQIVDALPAASAPAPLSDAPPSPSSTTAPARSVAVPSRPAATTPDQRPGCLSVKTRNGHHDHTSMVVTQTSGRALQVANASDTELKTSLSAGSYWIDATRVPGEPPIRERFEVRPGELTKLCLDLLPGGGLCASVEHQPLQEGAPCP